MTVEELHAKMLVYAATLDGEKKDEWWTTPRSLAIGQIHSFLEWLQADGGSEHG